MPNQFDFVSITKKANVHYEGRSISHLIELKDGTKKTLGVILPTDKPLTFKTHVAERIEIISGKCNVQIGDELEVRIYSNGDSFYVPENSKFKINTDEVIDYICHLG
ncbi:Pyrimidine/purine nucleoside phosphorylase [Acinetobacter oleivorans]|nr:Pyrimidine/purine nucleoside phosphorylase [Acinetobacter oleivorans]CAI3099565.1 Pyrimidine/purine nucleoside phosphorylase [Acinetobacter oleivorans]CAI3099572.1 Pyrimidine/purine nucleoside phosphorylase [Acinetobacter oleivorans]CAI3099611.1 Pyrimidine/purine nucleoside phosphorylase [Acinetobacter oleivorans]CAI3118930.1 Pyrimidine/purine nucleoside phosphorylase [Acinetobacter oleivorans]